MDHPQPTTPPPRPDTALALAFLEALKKLDDEMAAALARAGEEPAAS